MACDEVGGRRQSNRSGCSRLIFAHSGWKENQPANSVPT
jgi:hypothetical protein